MDLWVDGGLRLVLTEALPGRCPQGLLRCSLCPLWRWLEQVIPRAGWRVLGHQWTEWTCPQTLDCRSSSWFTPDLHCSLSLASVSLSVTRGAPGIDVVWSTLRPGLAPPHGSGFAQAGGPRRPPCTPGAGPAGRAGAAQAGRGSLPRWLGLADALWQRASPRPWAPEGTAQGLRSTHPCICGAHTCWSFSGRPDWYTPFSLCPEVFLCFSVGPCSQPAGFSRCTAVAGWGRRGLSRGSEALRRQTCSLAPCGGGVALPGCTGRGSEGLHSPGPV